MQISRSKVKVTA